LPESRWWIFIIQDVVAVINYLAAGVASCIFSDHAHMNLLDTVWLQSSIHHVAAWMS
jgi:hypothetical protein